MSNSSLASSTTNTFSENTGLNGTSSTLQCRVQYLDDTDPFSSVNLPEPARPPSFTFLTSTILSNQLNSVHKVLNAPHKVNMIYLKKKKKKKVIKYLFFYRLLIVHFNYVDKMEVNLNLDLILILIKHLMNNEKILNLLQKG
jgi:hypothetical protein